MNNTTTAWVDEIWRRGLRPDVRLSVSEWADRYRTLAGKTASEPGPWRTDRTPYLREVMNAMSAGSPYQRVVLMAGAQLGKTEAALNLVGSVIHHTPGPLMIVLPTVETAKRWSRQRLDPLVDARPLRGLVKDPRSRDSGNTVLSKEFPGGLAVVTGANSAVGLRSMPARFLVMDEVDGFPADADNEGDPVDLAVQRTVTFGARRKIILVSTPTVAGLSRIEAAYLESDQRKFWVPCPACGVFQVLKWSQVQWPEGNPQGAAYVCEHCGTIHDNAAKAWMLPRGEWRAEAEGDGTTAGFWISSLYSPPGWLSWGEIATDFVKARSNPIRLKTWTNTKLAETWQERGEAPEWERLFERRESYPIGRVPRGGLVLTAGVDVQKDRLEVEVVAWGRGLESWSVVYEVLMGPSTGPEVWRDLDRLLGATFETEAGGALSVSRLAVDTGYETQTVYSWARRHGARLVMPVKGSDTVAVPVGAASPVDVTSGGHSLRRGLRVWPVGVGLLKRQLYGWLRLVRDGDAPPPAGYCHFPEYDAEFFKMLTAEELVKRTNRAGYPKLEWQKMRARNEALDCRVYATAAALALGLDRWPETRWAEVEEAQRDLMLSPPLPPAQRSPAAAVMATPPAREAGTPGPARAVSPATVRSRWMSGG
ncbi:phage terminase large subunit family protein [Pararhodospirillum oryzae]|uniref:Terminase n=1 Tax=Pararhodospirillum oryzae TaxID=478448 RepID=A0A512H924_9PROT|nr:phage terminase large subunit family protein [Pararhodospirillum oryzae]GEO81953.1 terminase [Pararhodospirillum oryzae]